MNRNFSVLLCVPLQLCEDLFSRVSENQSSQLSYSVEVSPSLGGRQGRGLLPLGRKTGEQSI